MHLTNLDVRVASVDTTSTQLGKDEHLWKGRAYLKLETRSVCRVSWSSKMIYPIEELS